MERAETDELLARLLDQVAALEAEVEDLKRSARPDPSAPQDDDVSVSRRGLLKKVGGAVAAGVAGAAVASTLGPAPAGANTGGAAILGADNTADAVTAIRNGDSRAYFADAFSRIAVQGVQFAESGQAVSARVLGQSSTSVLADTSGHHSQVAVVGDTTSGLGEGIGVWGKTGNGIGVRAEAQGPGGYGLEVRGKAVFSRSGKITFSRGQASRTVSVPVTTASLVLATIQGNVEGTWVRGVGLDTGRGVIAIRLNKAAPVGLTVGWFVVN
jgi:hypothetical protein